MNEWRAVPGFDGYLVDVSGQVFSTLSNRTLKQHVNKTTGYVAVGMTRKAPDGRPIRGAVDVHRLVARAFLGPRPDGMEIRHLDGDSTNSRAENLAYGTPSENRYDAVRHGTHAMVAREHCPHSHPYDEANTIVYGGRRRCRTCRRAMHRRQAAARTVARLAARREVAA